MKFRNHSVILLLVLLASCNPSPEKQAKDLLKKSIQAHEIGNSWENLESIKFSKWTRLLNEAGEIESETLQWNEFRFTPFFEGKITWEVDSVTHISYWDGAKMHYSVGGNEIKNPDFLAQKKKDFDAAFYALAQPWKLLDEGPTLRHEGMKTLENGELVEVIAVDYGKDADLWWYYFDRPDNRLVANEVQLKDHRSLIYDLSFQTSGGLLLHGERESFRVNEEGDILFLRAEYRYSDYELVFK